MNLSNRLISVKMTLNHVFYISYLVPISRIRPFLPEVLQPATAFPEHMFVSIVGMKCNGVRIYGFPWPSFDYDQLNVRTYVIDPQTGTPAVYFFRSGVSSGIIPLLTSIFGITWEKINFDLQPSIGQETARPNYKVIGDWQEDLYFEITEPESHSEEKGAFPDLTSEISNITGPRIAFMASGKHTIRYEATQEILSVQRARLVDIRFQLPVTMGLLKQAELSRPDSVLLASRTKLGAYLPPQRVST